MAATKATSVNSFRTRLPALPPGAIRILQITDSHLLRDKAGQLMGIDTYDAFNRVLEQVKQSRLPIDLILATGDLVHDASAEGYDHLYQGLAQLGLPVYCLPGNHDHPARLAQKLNNDQIHTVRSLQLESWSLIFLDSTLAGTDAGHLCAAELGRLEMELVAHPERHALICLHHNPVPVGSRWLDTMVLNNAEEFFKIVDRYPRIKGILWGHIHQEYLAMRNGIRLIGSPSTCFQFQPKQKEFALDDTPPGCRWLALLPDGRISTAAMYLQDFVVPENRIQTGY